LNENIKAPLVEAMKNYEKCPCVGFHIPGHNMGEGVLPAYKKLIGEKALKIDTTDEFDCLGTLYPATGAIKDAMEEAAKAFGAEKTFFLTGGSTVGNLAIALGMTTPGQKIILGRNSHRSILSGAVISGADPIWLIPKKIKDWAIFGGVEVEDLERTIKENPDASLVWITNPTYEGMLSDMEGIVKVCKKYGVSLVVDEAHGCLWSFSDRLPKSALELGADAVVHSLHKTGGSLSQSSMLHIAKNSKLDADRIEKALMLLHTTSPSVLLMGSLDAARANLSSAEGKKMIDNAIDNANYFREEISKMENVSALDPRPEMLYDPTKVFIKVKGLSGKKLEEILEKEYKIEIESASDEGLLILSNIGSKRKEFEYLAKALKEISARNYKNGFKDLKFTPLIDPKLVMRLRDAFFSPKELVKKEDTAGRVCSEVIALCPPGISVLLPGELIREEHLPYLSQYEYVECVKESAR